MKTVAIIQARMGSSRMPGKIFSDLSGRPVLAWVLDAAHATLGVDALWIATSVEPADDEVAIWCQSNGIPVHRGSEHDVLGRYIGAIDASGAEVVVRITADCPFLDPAVIAQTIRLRAVTCADYVSNIDPPTWPDGLDCEVIKSTALRVAAQEATRAAQREHVTPFIRNNRARFSSETLIAPLPGLAKERWTLDTPSDLEFLRAVASRLPAGRAPSFLDVLDVLDRHPNLSKDQPRNRTKFRVFEFAGHGRTEHRPKFQLFTAFSRTGGTCHSPGFADLFKKPYPAPSRRIPALRNAWRRRKGL